MNADGTGAFRLTNDGPGITNLDATFSPDGKKIAYDAGVTGGPGALVVMNADGSDPATIVKDGVLGLAWQPLPEAGPPSSGRSSTPSLDRSPHIPGVNGSVCDIMKTEGNFFGDGAPDTAYSYSLRANGGCRGTDGGDQIAIAPNGGAATVHAGPFSCSPACPLFSVVDVNGDGRQELVIGVHLAAPTAPTRLEILTVIGSGGTGTALVPITLTSTGHPLTLGWGSGGAGGWASGFDCRDAPPRIISVDAVSRDGGSTYRVTRTAFAISIDPGAGTATAAHLGTNVVTTGYDGPRGPSVSLCGGPNLAG
jgi:hypothetical protein